MAPLYSFMGVGVHWDLSDKSAHSAHRVPFVLSPPTVLGPNSISSDLDFTTVALACKAGSHPLILPRSSTISAQAGLSGVGCSDTPRDKLHNSPWGHWLTQAFLCPLLATGSPDKH